MIAFCCDDVRRIEVGKHPTIVGIDFLEVSSDQHRLFVHFVPAAPGVTKVSVPPGITSSHCKITGGERIASIRILGTAYQDNMLVVTVDDDGLSPNGVGDFSFYRFELIGIVELDPTLASVDFSFKRECPTDFDCKPIRSCPTEQLEQSSINYLAKDYASFRQLMLDRLATLIPNWTERSPADMGVVLVELLAYVGDQLSYRQDAVATEAYLGTARRRISVRRHAKLVDYVMHEGVSARVWIQVRVLEDDVLLPKETQFFSHLAGFPNRISPKTPLYDQAIAKRPIVFESLQDRILLAGHQDMPFYTWSGQACCLLQGVTSATLRGHFSKILAGDVLILEQIVNPLTKGDRDVDRSRRHAVRLTMVSAFGPDANPLTDPLTGQLITEIAWHADDALPFSLCVAVNTPFKEGTIDTAVAQGNIVLADHGQKISQMERLKYGSSDRVPQSMSDSMAVSLKASRFRPRLQQRPLTFAMPLFEDEMPQSALAFMNIDPSQAEPAIQLSSELGARKLDWFPARDLLNSDRQREEFVVEVESDGSAFLRFGDDRNGARPEAGTLFFALYRVGGGASGNVGSDSLVHIVSDDSRIDSVRNPIAATGGVDPETLERVRQFAPAAFRRQERAVTEEDYAEVAQRHPEVQRAVATLRWTGSWYTVYLTIDRVQGRPIDDDFIVAMRRHMERFRMAGYDLEIDAPREVSLELDMHVCVDSRFERAHVKAALLDLFSNRLRTDGSRGFFHPDNFTFNQSVFSSRVIAAAASVPGVESVQLTTFHRQGHPSSLALISGVLEIGRLEVARLDNDRNFPERGVLRLDLGGGR